MRVTCTIDGRVVALTDWQADSAVNWGYRTFTGKIPESVTWAEQESPVVLWLDDGSELWAGKITQDPWATDGMRDLRAEGYANVISASKTRLPYRIDGAGLWVAQDAEPHEFDYDDQFDLDLRPSLMKVRMGNGGAGTIGVGEGAGFLIWVEGGLITKYSIDVTNVAAYAAFDIISKRFTGPTGTRTTIATHSLNHTTKTTRSPAAWASPEDGLYLRVEANAGASSATRRRTKWTAIKVYGRTNDDAFSASQVVSDVGSDAGLDVSGVQTNSLPILPLDWTEDHTALLSYMAELTDWHWEAGNGSISFGPWSTTWTGYQAYGIKADWQPQKRYNKVVVPFTYLSEASGEGEATASPDPFPGSEVTFYADELEHPQQTSTLADAVAANLVEYYASSRAAGRLTLGQVTDPHGEPSDGFRVRAGHIINVADRPDLGPQRIVAMNYRKTDQATEVIAEINADFAIDRVLWNLRKGRKP